MRKLLLNSESTLLGLVEGRSAADSGVIFDIKRYSIHDGPGIRTTIFFKGCPLNCWWCHNPESQAMEREQVLWLKRCIRCGACQEACEQGVISLEGDSPRTDSERCTLCGACVAACYAEAREIVGREMTVAQVMVEIERDIPFFDESGGGVTFSGGEPLAQGDFLEALLNACQESEIHTVLDTCGYAPWELLDRLRELVDLFLYDLKLMDDEKHCHYTGVSNALVIQNLRALAERGHPIVLRVPVIPGINDDEENMQLLGAFAADLPHLVQVDLLPYHHSATSKYERLERSYGLNQISPPTEESMAKIAGLMRGFGLSVKIGG
jgi:pyruvate formate lyase activating enzyme